jgi:hypothetical protein
MRFFIFIIWLLSYGLLLLPTGILFANRFPQPVLPTEILTLILLPLAFYLLLHTLQNRQKFNFIIANLFISLPSTTALLLISLKHDLINYAYLFTGISCVMVLLVWWKYPAGARRIF